MMNVANTDQEHGITDGAILLLSLGEEEAAEVLKYLSPREVQKLGTAMAGMQGIAREAMDQVIRRFETDISAHTGLGADADAYLRSVLTRALGADKAGFLLDRILHTGDTSGIESLKWMDPTSVAELIRHEHPQIIASILVHLEADQSAGVLNQLPERVRADVLLRIATLDGIQPAALRELNDVLLKMLSGNEQIKRRKLGGIKTAADILNYVGSSSEHQILALVKQVDTELAQRIIDEMFTFENLIDADDRGMQLLLREVTPESLILALKGASAELRAKVFRCMPSRAAQQLREDLDARGPVKISDVEAQQKEILKIARRLTESGDLAINGMGEEQYV
ncbi:MAG: flagellar motor switch protein FliG [Pigmentiphaga sp.]|uniref:flagellar motor switch protein FliG n=1 Tax=Pigmentiphaga sp. TaxID=1977564 RepID=UPI0029A40CF2|nr:flagellar motor switch protein FliG [Pigmentiphaga sp.]MDX3904140.1 flagellar motor switch protein FliG [Pigmentiphaga sp.]